MPNPNPRWRPARFIGTSLVVIGIASTSFVPCALAVDLDTGTYRNRKLGVKLEVPEGWTLHRHTGYPSLLLILTPQKKPRGASISLAIDTFSPKQPLQRLVKKNHQGLRALGFRVVDKKQPARSGRAHLRATARTADGTMEIRQIYIPKGTMLFILTLCSPTADVQHWEFDLEQALEGLELQQPEHRSAQPRDPAESRAIEDGLMPLEDLPGERSDGESEVPPAAEENASSTPNGKDDREVSSRPNKPTSRPAASPSSRPATPAKE